MNIRDDFILKNIHKGYLVGGAVRDFLLDKTSVDRDIAIKGASEFAENLSKELNATFITLDSENKIYRLVLDDKTNYLDISELQGNSIEEDLTRRDFTINAIAYDLEQDKFIDITGGIDDIKNKKLRTIKEENFVDDPLRIIRAYRFMATLGFEMDDELTEILKKHLTLINQPAKERVHDEIMKLFGGKYTSETLLKMYDIGLLEIIFPCVKEMGKVPSNTHHHLDLIHHVIETVRQIELQYDLLTPTLSPEGRGSKFTLSCKEREKKCAVQEHLDRVDFGGYPRINHLKIAGFLHDIGKYSTWTIEDDGKSIWKRSDGTDYPNDKSYRHRFIKHDMEGEKLVVPLLKNLKFSNKQIDYIKSMVRWHIYPSSVISAPNVDNKTMMRYVRKMEDNVIDNIILAKSDRLSACGPAVTKEMTEENLNGLNKLLEFYLEVKPTLKPLPKLLDGNEIMQILGIKQSPDLGKIINELHEAQLNEEVNSKDEAVAFIKNFGK